MGVGGGVWSLEPLGPRILTFFLRIYRTQVAKKFKDVKIS